MSLSLAFACTTKLFPVEGRVVIKPLSGIEAMQCIGWDKTHWKNGSPYQRNSDVQLRKMAGNAFSGFALAPVLSALLACRGLVCAEEDLSTGYDYGAQLIFFVPNVSQICALLIPFVDSIC